MNIAFNGTASALILSLLLTFLFGCPFSCSAYGVNLTEIFKHVELIEYGETAKRDYSYITEESKKELLHAKSVVISFLKAINKFNGTSFQFLDNSLRTRYKDEYSLRGDIFESEVLTEMEIYDFIYKESEITFFLALVQASEGIECNFPFTMKLKKIDAAWRIVSFKP